MGRSDVPLCHVCGVRPCKVLPAYLIGAEPTVLPWCSEPACKRASERLAFSFDDTGPRTEMVPVSGEKTGPSSDPIPAPDSCVRAIAEREAPVPEQDLVAQLRASVEHLDSHERAFVARRRARRTTRGAA